MNKYLKSNWKSEAIYITRYAGSGVVNTLVGFFVIFTAMFLGFTPIVSNIAGYAVGFMLGFVLSKKFVFRSNGHFVVESLRYLIVFIVAFLCNLMVLRIALNYIPAIPSQIIAAMTYTFLMYLLTRLFVFQNPLKP